MTRLPADPSQGTHQLVVSVDVDANRLDDRDYRNALVQQVADLATERLGRPPVDRRLRLCLSRLCYDRRVQPWVVMAGSRRTDPARVRHELMWIGVRCAGMSHGEVGRWLGGMDHTTVLYGRRKIDGLIAKDRRVAQRLMGVWAQTQPKLQEAA